VTRMAALGLGLCTAALSAVIWREYAPSPWQASPPPILADTSFDSPVATSSGDDGKVHDWVATNLARPLFEPSRRPPATGTETSLPRLTGIVISAHLRDAMFISSGGKRAIVVTTGSRLDGMLIESIDPDGVVVLDAGGTRRLRPSFERHAPNPAPPPAPSIAVNDRPIFLMSDSGPPPPDGFGQDPVAGFPIPNASVASP
jgi:hypothetical protein